jgi:multidrug efflux pump
VVIPVVTIPLSLVGVCFFLYLMGYSINLLTLLAMVLAIGLVVDDAIVVVENIHRHLDRGKAPLDAAIEGMREIFAPVVAMTVTLAAVYAPIGFAQGLTGSLFREFAVTLAGAVIISGFIAVTLSPMLSGRILRGHGAQASRFQRIVDRTSDRVSGWYGRRVAATLRYRPVTVMVAGALFATMVFLFLNTSSELAPEEDIGFMFSIVNAPAYATSDYTQLFTQDAVKSTADVPELNVRFSIVGFGGSNQAFAGFGMKEWSEAREEPGGGPGRGAGPAQRDCRGAGLRVCATHPARLRRGAPRAIIVRSTGEASQVFEVAEEIKNRAQASGRFIVVQNSLAFSQPQARVTIDRDRAAALGVSIAGNRHDTYHARRRRRGVALRPRQPLLRRHHAGGPKRTVQPGEPRRILCPERQRIDGAALGGSLRGHPCGARRGRAVQSAELRHYLRAAAPRFDHGRCAGHAQADRPGGHAGRLLRGLRRPVPAGGQGG